MKGVPMMSMKAVWLVDGLCTVLFIFIMAVIFVLPSPQQDFLLSIFSILYRTGAWIMGAGLVFTCLWGRGKPGLMLGIMMLIYYMITTFFTLFGLIVLTTEWELLWYIHPLIIIPGCILALWHRKKVTVQ